MSTVIICYHRYGLVLPSETVGIHESEAWSCTCGGGSSIRWRGRGGSTRDDWGSRRCERWPHLRSRSLRTSVSKRRDTEAVLRPVQIHESYQTGSMSELLLQRSPRTWWQAASTESAGLWWRTDSDSRYLQGLAFSWLFSRTWNSSPEASGLSSLTAPCSSKPVWEFMAGRSWNAK